MKLSEEVKTKINEAALQHGLPISIVRAVVCVESSGWTDHRTRYEPNFYHRYIEHMKDLTPEEKTKRATSWGAMQVMGQVARELGFKGKFEELLVLEVGLYWGCRHLKNKMKLYLKKWGWAGVFAAYNAGSPIVHDGKFINQKYVNEALDYARSAI